MRCVAGVGLLALVGCNQIFGIPVAKEWDAAAPDMPHVRLTWQIATVTPTGGPDATLAYPALDPAPKLRIAPINVALDDSPDRATYASDGAVAIPQSYVGTTWRLEYTLSDNVPHEVQWTPEGELGHVVVPLFGRLDRGGVPARSGYLATPSNPPSSFGDPRVFTTGLWTEGIARPSGIMADYDFFNAVSLSGPKGRPDPAAGDRAFVVDFTVNPTSTCQYAVGSGLLPSAQLTAEVHSAQTIPWDTGLEPVSNAAINVSKPLTRLINALGALDGREGFAGTLLFGIGASPLMPALTATPSPAPMLSARAILPIPMMLTLAQCPYDQTPPMTAQPAALDAFPHLVHMQITNTRTVAGTAGLRLTSGIETVALSAATEDDVRFSAAIPVRVQLTNPAQQAFALDGAGEQVAVGPAGGVFTLQFAAEATSANAPSDLRIDYYEVTLYRIDGATRTAQRVYTVTAPAVRIDGPALVSGVEYVFEIRSYKGHPKAQRGDFSAVDYPYGSSVIFTRTFKTM
jgi:hypothetical protein